MKPLPARIVNRIAAGENALAVIREHRGMSIEDLAGRCRLTADFLTQCEEGTRFLPDRNIKAAADALDVTEQELWTFARNFSDCDMVTRHLEDE